jgi:molybdate transport system substrate-binding protein
MGKRLLGLSALVLAAAAPGLSAAWGADLQVVSSGGFAAAYHRLEPKYQTKSHDALHMSEGASMGQTPTAIPQRLARGEDIDVVILAKESLQQLAAQGKIVPGTETDLIDSYIGMAVKAGRPFPDIGTGDKWVAAVKAAPRIGVSDSASGVYLTHEVFPKLGVDPAKVTVAPGSPVGAIIAKGDVDIGFQQVSELMPIAGITIQKIPAPYQKVTVFSAGVVASSHHKDEAKALIRYLASPDAAADIRATGADPSKH